MLLIGVATGACGDVPAGPVTSPGPSATGDWKTVEDLRLVIEDGRRRTRALATQSAGHALSMLRYARRERLHMAAGSAGRVLQEVGVGEMGGRRVRAFGTECVEWSDFVLADWNEEAVLGSPPVETGTAGARWIGFAFPREALDRNGIEDEGASQHAGKHAGAAPIVLAVDDQGAWYWTWSDEIPHRESSLERMARDALASGRGAADDDDPPRWRREALRSPEQILLKMRERGVE